MAFSLGANDLEVIEKCPVCDGTSLSVISQAFRAELMFFETSCCKSCDFVYRSTRPKLSWFKNAWTLRDEDHGLDSEAQMNPKIESFRKTRYLNLAKVLEQHIPGRRLIDIGTGTGTGLREFVTRNWDVVGLEPDAARARYGQKLGLNVVHGTVEEYTSDKKVDVATIIHVLEHFHAPDEFLRHVISQVNENGFVYIEVPDLTNFVNWSDALYLEHMNNFTEHSLLKLARRVGLSPVARLYPKTKPHGVMHLGILFQLDKEGKKSANMTAARVSESQAKAFYRLGLFNAPEGVLKYRVSEVTDICKTVESTDSDMPVLKNGVYEFVQRSPLEKKFLKVVSQVSALQGGQLKEKLVQKVLYPIKPSMFPDKDFDSTKSRQL